MTTTKDFLSREQTVAAERAATVAAEHKAYTDLFRPLPERKPPDPRRRAAVVIAWVVGVLLVLGAIELWWFR